MVEMTRGIVNAVSRTVQFIHLPVPRDRTDGAYFAPLKDLNLPETTDLYLGLIHHGDGAGDIKRLHEAQKVVRVAGVASECGWGRGDPERIGEYLEAHRALAEAG
ncbi:MAG: hypothetical protein HQ503_05555 [Rhodospirillales bacterium]|nr:hypothetical protein [Rhodospirillales bacterium]